MENLSFRFRK